MSEVTEFLRKSGLQYLATIGADGRPKVRPFQFMLEDGGRIFFCTSNKKKVCADMKERPYVEICASGEENSWIRLSGKAVFVDDSALKAKVQDQSPLVKSIYKTADNPDFEIFYLEDASTTIADFSGKPPRVFKP